MTEDSQNTGRNWKKDVCVLKNVEKKLYYNWSNEIY